MKKRYIFAPGPTAVPPEVLLAGAQPTIHHRSVDFPPIFDRCQKALREAFQTQHPVAVLASSGTGALEAAMVSTISPGEKVICLNSGKFGERWCLVAKAYGMNLLQIDVEWGKGLDPALIEKALKENPDAKAVVLPQTETSTGVVNDIEAIASITRNSSALLIVDAVSAFLAEPMKMDEWGVDIVGTGAQKAIMLPPGLGFAAIGPRAQEAIKACKTPRFYFDLAKYLKSMGKSDTPFTPAVNMFYALEEALKQVLTDGLEESWARHQVLARAARAAVKAMNIEIFADPPSVVLTACKAPAGIDGGAVVKALKAMGITIAGGQEHLKGKIFRFATLGYYDAFDCMTIVSALELALGQLGHNYTKGAGAAAALEVLRAYDPAKGWKAALAALD
jgi:aspartate aminotransferase-like enzyme